MRAPRPSVEGPASRGLSVMHVSQTTIGGAAEVAAGLVRDQVRRGWHVAVACPAHGDLPRAVRAAGGTHQEWTAFREPGRTTLGAGEAGRTALVETVALARLVRRTRPDIVHLHSSTAGVAGRLAIRGRRPTVFQPHGWSFLALTGSRRRAAAFWERLAARWCAAVVCVSEEEREVGERAGIRAPWRVVLNGVDVGARPGSDRVVARRRLGLTEAPLVVSPGRVCKAKGQDTLIDAWPAVRTSVPDATLAIVGDGPDREALERRSSPGVRFTGWTATVADWLQAADVVVLPSRWEAGLCLAAMEAMASCRSVVATDVAGTRTGLRDGAGVVVPVESPSQLAAALNERLLNPAKAAAEGLAGRATVEARYDLASSVEEVARLYSDVLAARGSRA